MLANLHPSLVITRREIRETLRDWRITLPIFFLTTGFPILMNFTAAQVEILLQRYGGPMAGTRLIPFQLMMVGFFPTSVALVIALESLVGERERRTIEPLLSTPLSDTQIYAGKLMASLALPLCASFLAIFIYMAGAYLQSGWLPTPLLLVQVALLTIVQTFLMISGAVVVSSQTTSVRAANMMAMFIVIPMGIVIQGESLAMFWGRYSVLWWSMFGQVLITLLLVRTGISHFNREDLLGRNADNLNLRGSWQVFWSEFRGKAGGITGWYRRELGQTLRFLAVPVFSMVVALGIAIWMGMYEAEFFALPANVLDASNIGQGFVTGLDAIKLYSVSGVATIFFHNVRAVLLASLFGMFSFGVFGVIILMLPLGLAGYLMGNLAGTGLSPFLFLEALVLPHGIMEIPAIILAGAAIIRLGGTLAAPARGKTIGEAWLHSMADWAKVMAGLVLPLLLLAAFLEVLVTPRVAMMLLGR